MSLHRRWHHIGSRVAATLFALTIALATGCGGRIALPATDGGADGGTDAGPPTSIAELPVDVELSFPELSSPVDVVRDIYGIPHIYAENVSDLAFAIGFVQAQDRLVQMLLARAFANGSTAELGGTLDPGLIDSDIFMRYVGLHRVAAQIYNGLAPDDELKIALDSYSDGVNSWLNMLVVGDASPPAGTETVSVSAVRPWNGIDTITFGRLLSWQLSFDPDNEVANTANLEAAISTFDAADPATDPDLAARAGLYADYFRWAPSEPAFIIDGPPNMPVDMGTHAAVAAWPRPVVSNAVLENALHGAELLENNPFRPFGPSEEIGSNNWVVHGSVSETGNPILSNDPHLSLDNPTIFYQMHLDLKRMGPDEPSVVGVGFAGAPAVVLGHNEHIAWGVTTNGLDVSAAYAETVMDCPTGGTLNCVLFEGNPVEIETITETLGIGLGFQILEERDVDVEIVPHHGMIVPEISGGAVVPRTTTEAISYRWTGFDPSEEIRAFWMMNRATDIAEAEDAIDFFEVGGQNWVVADTNGDIFYSTSMRLPIPSPAAFTFEYPANPTGVAPAYILDGTGGFEWSGDMSDSFLPHAINPAAGFVSTANNDQTGTTADNDPWRGDIDATVYYTGYDWDIGFRDGRIKEMLEAAIAGDGVSFEEMQAVQNDNLSAMGRRMTPHLLDAMQALEEHLAGTTPRPDLDAFATALPMANLTRMREAITRLTAWDYRAADGVEIEVSAKEIDSSVATSIFNAWLSYTVRLAFDDEVAAMGRGGGTTHSAKALLHAVENTGDLLVNLHPATGDSILFDDLATPGVLETRDLIFVTALDLALEFLEETCCGAENASGFGTADMSEWRWGLLHTLRLESSLPALSGVSPLDNPRLDDPLYGSMGSVSFGYPRHADNFGVDASGYSMRGFSYRYGAGPTMRMTTEVLDGVMYTENVSPGGMVWDPASPHFGDSMELWRRNETHPVPFWEAEVVAAAESRMVLAPAN